MISVHMTTARRFASGMLKPAIESVLAQDFHDLELIVCDDGSTDGTEGYLASLARSDRRVQVFRHERNLSNLAISLAHCMERSDPSRPWITWMFDDCLMLPGALTSLLGAATAEPVEMVYGITELMKRDGSVVSIGAAPIDEVRARIANASAITPNGGILIRRDVFDRVGWYDSSIVLRRSCDWDLMRRIVDSGTPFLALPVVVMREYGELQRDSLRNAFVTSFGLMQRYAAARDASRARLDLASILAQPTDWIPPDSWSPRELDLMRYMFAEYFLSVADVARAFPWAQALSRALPQGDLTRDNLIRAASSPGPAEVRSMAAGAFTAMVLAAYRERPDAARDRDNAFH